MYADVYDEVNYTITPIHQGHSPDILISPSHCNIRTDISLSDRHIIKIWGQLKNSNQLPLYKATVTLTQLDCTNGKVSCTYLAETITDSSGFYFFDTLIQNNACYRIVVQARNRQNNRILIPKFSRCHLSSNSLEPCHQDMTSLLYKNKGGSP